jgi:hypothetical protein
MWPLQASNGTVYRFQVAGFRKLRCYGLKPDMKLHIVGTANRLNLEHRTSNIEHRILNTLRFIDFKLNRTTARASRSALSRSPRVHDRGAHSQRAKSNRILQVRWIVLGQFLIYRIHYSTLDVRCSMFDVHSFLI